MNCWDFKQCGREPGGRNVEKDGVCPAASYRPADGFLGGRNGGKACAFITGTFCDDFHQGCYRDKSKNCWDCDFYRGLRARHGSAFSLPAFAMHLSRRDPEAFRGFCRENGFKEPARR